MKQENNINNLTEMELIKLIFEEVKRNSQELNRINNELGIHRTILNQHTKILEEHDKKFEQIDKRFEQIDKKFERMDKRFDKIDNKLEEHDNNFKDQDKRFDTLEKKIDNLDKIEKLHFEYTRNRFGRLDKKIEANFSCLDNKIENEVEERKIDISRIEGLNDFEKIMLNDFGSRISILEEESEKYTIN